MNASVLEPVRATFRAVATTVVPETVALEPGAWAALETRVERALADQPDRVRKQLVTFVRLVELAPLAWFRRRFTNLDSERRTAALKRFERSRYALLRRGFWGLRTLIFLGYYSQPTVQLQLGYRAHPEGWALRRRSPSSSRDFPPITLDVPVVPDAFPSADGA